MSSSSKRHSILPPVAQAGPKAPVRFSSSLVIADSAILTGAHTIQLRTESLVHPRAKIESLAGAIDIGKRCVVHERTHVGALPAGGGGAGGGGAGGGGAAITIMDYCTVEVGSTIEAGGTVIGEGTIVGVGSRVGSGAVVGKYCTISPRTTIAPGEIVPDYTVVFSNGLHRRDKRDVVDIRTRAQARQLEVLRKLIPSNPSKFQ
ncbi:putative transferase hexapeptide domain-containing protein [Diaporthe ampelina]|uniref:Dynactin subunit 6 n=1 Tax=Diaporthe ampelina TaxID=1214573 RepID=A0A0G2FMD0_9PEZI|nr:putative transferase hexapeptide domain-containing protein [Diaporthe ampelina]